MFKKLEFWLPVATLVYLVAKNYLPDLPFNQEVVTQALLVLVAWLIGAPLEAGVRRLIKK